MTEAPAGEMIVADLDHELRLERLPFRRTLGRPAARSAGRVAGEAGRRDELFQLLRSALFSLPLLSDEVKPTWLSRPRVVVEAEQQRADRLLPSL